LLLPGQIFAISPALTAGFLISLLLTEQADGKNRRTSCSCPHPRSVMVRPYISALAARLADE
jgi:hypothetical protein